MSASRSCLAALAFLALALALRASAAPPTIDLLSPMGAQRGTTASIKVDGKIAPWPPQAWADVPGIRLKPTTAPSQIEVQIDKDCPVGPHLIRLYNADGASNPRLFMVSDVREIAEAEPNDEPPKAQVVSGLPLVINGVLEKPGDVDCYSVHLDAGQRLVASLQGRRLGSPMDPMLHVLSPDGIEVAFAHDGLGLDPLLAYSAPKSAEYVVRVSAFAYPPAADVKLTGGSTDLYRLSLTTGPCAKFTTPAATQRAQAGNVSLRGYNLQKTELIVDAAVGLDQRQLFCPTPSPDGFLSVELSDAPQLRDDEARKLEKGLSIPVGITGRLAAPGDERRFTFIARKGESIKFVVRAGAIFSQMDAVVRVEDAEHKVLAAANGPGTPSDPALTWTAGADGTYTVVVADLYHKAGPDYVYHLSIAHPKGTFVAGFDTHAYTLSQGKTATVKFNVIRQDGHNDPLVAVAVGLPPGVTANTVDVPEKAADLTMTLSAAADAKAFTGPFHISIVGTDPSRPQAQYAFYILRQAAESATPQEFINYTYAPWLTVLPPPSPPATTQATTVPTTKPATKP